MRTTFIVLLTIGLFASPALARSPPGGAVPMQDPDRPPTTQPDWQIAGLWFDLAGRPWTVTIEHADGARSAHVARGSTAPATPPPGLPLVVDRGLREQDPLAFTRLGWSQVTPGEILPADRQSSETWIDASHQGLLRITDWRTHISPGRPNRGSRDPGPTITWSQHSVELVRDGRALGSVPAKRTRPAGELKQALSHPDWRIRRDAIRELSLGTDPEDVALLIAGTGERLDVNRILAAQALGRLKAKNAITPLVGLLGRASSLVRSAAIDALAGMGPGIGPELLAALEIGSGGSAASEAAGLVFAQWDRPTVADMLADGLKTDDRKVRLSALTVLFALSGPEFARLAGQFMLAHVGRPDFARDVDFVGGYLLNRAVPEDLPVETLCRIAENHYAARALMRAGPRAIPIILEAMALELEADEDLRPSRRRDMEDLAVARMLGLVGAIHGIQPTPEQPEPPDMARLYAGIEELRLRAWVAIGFRPQADEAVVRALIADSAAEDAELRAAVIHGLANNGHHPAAIPRLLEMLEDEDEQVRRAAGFALDYRTDGVRDMLARIAPLDGHGREFAAGAVWLARKQPWGLGYAIDLAIANPSKGQSALVLAALNEYLRQRDAPLPEPGLTADNLKTWWEQTGKAWSRRVP